MYAKVFQQIYKSSLAKVGPWEALVTFQQMLILADWQGIVEETAESIAAISTVPVDIIKKGIEVLEQADPESRNPDEDGRRILRLNPNRTWGWRITNYTHYRDMKNDEERKAYNARYYATVVKPKRAKREANNSIQENPLQNLKNSDSNYSVPAASAASPTPPSSPTPPTTATATADSAAAGGDELTKTEVTGKIKTVKSQSIKTAFLHAAYTAVHLAAPDVDLPADAKPVAIYQPLLDIFNEFGDGAVAEVSRRLALVNLKNAVRPADVGNALTLYDPMKGFSNDTELPPSKSVPPPSPHLDTNRIHALYAQGENVGYIGSVCYCSSAKVLEVLGVTAAEAYAHNKAALEARHVP